MKRTMLLINICACLLGYSQNTVNSSGIIFEEKSSWNEIVERARIEKKLIFISCYATWCMPCKKMKVEVYTDDSVGILVNQNYISIELQIDTSSVDNSHIKNWYGVAKKIRDAYNVSSVPTYIFLSANEVILHKDVGQKSRNNFLKLVNNALNPQVQFYTLLREYKVGRKDYTKMQYLAYMARSIGEESLAIEIAKDYIDNHLLNLKGDFSLNRKNIDFITSFLNGSQDKAFRFYFLNSKKIDSIINVKDRNYSQDIIDKVIFKEEINPYLNTVRNNKELDWKLFYRNIKKKYNNNYADRIVVKAKMDWYKNNSNWKMYVKYAIRYIQKYNLDTINWFYDVNLNHIAWDAIFLHSTKRSQIRKGLKWMKSVVERNENESAMLDTYANLLYKFGKKKEAIAIEEKAIQVDPKNATFLNVLQKMKLGVSTSPEQ
jgi:thioredoxin-related protein